MEKQFKVGDQVRLKKNLKVGKMYNSYELYEAMLFDVFCKILSVHPDIPSCCIGIYYYPYEMLTKRK